MNVPDDKSPKLPLSAGPESDIADLLATWPYREDDDVRRIRGWDGREKLQVRLPLGIEQYEIHGRPDGARPEGYESYLEYYKQVAERNGPDWTLGRQDFERLYVEGLLYYQRYLLFFRIGEYDLCIRDTTRNLELADFVTRYAADSEMAQTIEQYRPYIMRMRTMAHAVKLAKEGRLVEAVEVIEAGLEEIENVQAVDTPVFRLEKARSLIALRDLKNQLKRHEPVRRIDMLKEELKRAVSSEDYERAAALRDEIKRLSKSSDSEDFGS